MVVTAEESAATGTHARPRAVKYKNVQPRAHAHNQETLQIMNVQPRAHMHG